LRLAIVAKLTRTLQEAKTQYAYLAGWLGRITPKALGDVMAVRKKIKNFNFTYHFIWVCNLVTYSTERIMIEDIWHK
jgi:hypothetical protein